MKIKIILCSVVLIYSTVWCASESPSKIRRIDRSVIDTSGLECQEGLFRSATEEELIQSDWLQNLLQTRLILGNGLSDSSRNINARFGSQNMTLLEMCGKYQTTENLEELLKRKANPNEKHPTLKTNCIHNFVVSFLRGGLSKYQELTFQNPFPLLKKYGADFNVQDMYGNAPLHLAILNHEKHWLLAHWLLSEGANPALENFKGEDAISCVLTRNAQNIAQDQEENFYILLLHENLNPEYYENGEEQSFKNQLWCQLIIDAYLKMVQGNPQGLKEILHSSEKGIQTRLKLLFKQDMFPNFLQHMNKKIAEFENFQVSNVCKFGDQEVQYRPGF